VETPELEIAGGGGGVERIAIDRLARAWRREET
jgi:hypothetical protein